MPVSIQGLTIPNPNARASGNNLAATGGDTYYRTFWGQWEAANDLPNATNNSATGRAYANLAPGDTAWAQAPAGLYVCTDRGTDGGGDATWSFVSGSAAAGELHLYVDSVAGDDTNDGLTSGTAKATFDACLALAPTDLQADVFVHIAGSADYNASSLSRRFSTANGSLVIAGDDVVEIDTGTFDGADAAAISFTDSTKSWTVDEHVGRTMEVLGSYCTIIQNTATTLFLAGYSYTAAPAGNGEAYRIFEPACRLLVDPEGGIGGSSTPHTGLQELEFPGALIPGNAHNVVIANVKLGFQPGGFFISTHGSLALCGGVDVEEWLFCGGDTMVGINTYPMLTIESADEVAGWGWGAHFRSFLNPQKTFVGAGVVGRDAMYAGGSNTLLPGSMTLISGRSLLAGSANGAALSARPGTVVYAGINNSSSSRHRFLVLGTGTQTDAITASPGGTVVIGDSFDLPGDGWCTNALRAQGGTILIDTNNNGPASVQRGIDATTRVAVVEAGGRLIIENNGALLLAGGVNTDAIAVGATPTLVTTGASGGLTTAGDTVEDAGSVVCRILRDQSGN